jgi:ATP-binding cassette subfamily B (MDR/TAP) protein 1
MFIISILAMLSIGFQNYLFSSSASSLTSKLRSLSLRALLRQDSKTFSEFRGVMALQLYSRVL